MNKIKYKIIDLGLNYKKELLKIVLINLVLSSLLITFSIITKKYIFIGGIVLLIPLIIFLYFRYYKKLELNKIDLLQDNFINLIPYLKIYIENNFTIYSSFEELSHYSSEDIDKKIKVLLEDINNDKTIKPFITFSNSFSLISLKQLLICMYQMIDIGNNSQYMNQFSFLFEKIQEENTTTKLHYYDNKLNKQNNMPLIASALVIIAATVGIISIMGDLMNVL